MGELLNRRLTRRFYSAAILGSLNNVEHLVYWRDMALPSFTYSFANRPTLRGALHAAPSAATCTGLIERREKNDLSDRQLVRIVDVVGRRDHLHHGLCAVVARIAVVGAGQRPQRVAADYGMPPIQAGSDYPLIEWGVLVLHV